MKTGDSGIKRILKAFIYSYDGFKESFKTEAAFRQELLLCAVLFVAVFFVPCSIIEKLFLISTLFIVLLMELANTAIEAVVDRVSDERHYLSKKAKDVGSLLVLVAFIYLFIVWGTVLYGVFAAL
ncbi:MAG: diacylglycerol kinase [Campylobacteraceae bacterium]|jgi:diacylglycerol kinase (ATP)|nr:diacylglycerol kinase [Campylobacteraceae bacterium]